MAFQDFLKYFKIVKKWWWVTILLLGTTVGTMLVIVFLTEAEYEATTTVQVSAPPPQEVPLYSQFGRQAINDEINQTRSSFNELLLEGDVPFLTVETLPDIHITAGELREKMLVEIPDNSQLMYIRVRNADSETAALLANKLVEKGLQRYGELGARPTVNTRIFIEQELEVARSELKAAEAELIQFQIDNRIGTLNDAIGQQNDLIRSLRNTGDLARANGDSVKERAIEDIILEREAEMQNLIGLSPEYNKLVDRVERARSTYNFLLDRKTEAQIKENQFLQANFIQVITPARPPRRPVSLINGKLITLGAVGSILLGLLLSFLLEYLDISGAFGTRRQEHPDRPEAVALPDSVSY